MLNDIKDVLRNLRSEALVDITYVEPKLAQERLLRILQGLIDVITVAFERLDTHERETSVDAAQGKLENINMSLHKMREDIEELKNEAVFRRVL